MISIDNAGRDLLSIILSQRTPLLGWSPPSRVCTWRIRHRAARAQPSAGCHFKQDAQILLTVSRKFEPTLSDHIPAAAVDIFCLRVSDLCFGTVLDLDLGPGIDSNPDPTLGLDSSLILNFGSDPGS
ncbi:hypothetical protein EVAR_46865_1 [Eumeta japonica]|uniref:Uncharacterized protein n=1 Tax=Eumeta variegata TaxID=151549 RepID=A0A4C1XMP7_EUMVA|nr:hypothetical protein EVAR_46865_1 [Eumeta japonica]